MECFICNKHRGELNQPPGGYIYENEHWMVCHFPAEQSVTGQLVIESKRHFLDYAEMTDEEASSYGILVKKITSAIKQTTGAERVYSWVTVDGVPHFHAHFIPRMKDSEAKGMRFMAAQRSCDEQEAADAARKVRESTQVQQQITKYW